ncbi:hypothetical protein EsDP_00002170 [Epichloe bromicola]|uniref:Alpha/beta hydrolase fold-3 domain-containing protein n=1 Tax=Epichloe bromicola TaxID=79588 RepID=A0ABQ0CK14_9HYPO
MSPGLMPDELLKKLPHLHMILCEYDMLLAEGIRFTQRLEHHNKPYTVRIVEGEGHGWDKPPPMAPKESVFIEYGKATDSIARWLGRGCETDKESIKIRSIGNQAEYTAGARLPHFDSRVIRTLYSRAYRTETREEEAVEEAVEEASEIPGLDDMLKRLIVPSGQKSD